MSRISSNYSSSSLFLFLLARLTQSQSQFSNFSHELKIHLIISRVVTLCTLFTEWELWLYMFGSFMLMMFLFNAYFTVWFIGGLSLKWRLIKRKENMSITCRVAKINRLTNNRLTSLSETMTANRISLGCGQNIWGRLLGLWSPFSDFL